MSIRQNEVKSENSILRGERNLNWVICDRFLRECTSVQMEEEIRTTVTEMK